MEDDPLFFLKKKNVDLKKMEEDLKKNLKNGRRPKKKEEEKKGRRPKQNKN